MSEANEQPSDESRIEVQLEALDDRMVDIELEHQLLGAALAVHALVERLERDGLTMREALRRDGLDEERVEQVASRLEAAIERHAELEREAKRLRRESDQ